MWEMMRQKAPHCRTSRCFKCTLANILPFTSCFAVSIFPLLKSGMASKYKFRKIKWTVMRTSMANDRSRTCHEYCSNARNGKVTRLESTSTINEKRIWTRKRYYQKRKYVLTSSWTIGEIAMWCFYIKHWTNISMCFNRNKKVNIGNDDPKKHVKTVSFINICNI